MKKTTIMGILNITPDSFSDGGDYYDNPQKALERAQQMIKEGADSIDIGGESTRPGSESVDAQEELRRVIPVIQILKQHFGNDVLLCIDTWKHDVARETLEAGCGMVNSLGGFIFDEKLAGVVATSGCDFIMYHSTGKPKTMQQGDITYANVIKEISAFFEEQIMLGKKHGVKKEQFIIDPGIGFGKTVEQNIEIIKNLKVLETFKLPIAIGVSRKSFLGMILKDERNIETKPTERLEASLAATAIAVQNGASVVRTHDVWETKKFLTILDKFT